MDAMSGDSTLKPPEPPGRWSVVDLFSGAGGASFGFHTRGGFRIAGAVDAQKGKPSSGTGTLQCNLTYEANIGVRPLEVDLGEASPEGVRKALADELRS